MNLVSFQIIEIASFYEDMRYQPCRFDNGIWVQTRIMKLQNGRGFTLETEENSTFLKFKWVSKNKLHDEKENIWNFLDPNTGSTNFHGGFLINRENNQQKRLKEIECIKAPKCTELNCWTF